MILNIRVWSTLTLLLILSSCASQRDITYLQGASDGYVQKIADSYEATIKPDDMLAIMVNSRDVELAQMFNLPMISYQGATNVTGQNRVLGYLVDQDGNIDFPQLGEICVEGMTRSQLTKYIKRELISQGLVGDPVVTIQYQNYQVSVVGEVVKPGSFLITSDRVTIFDALSMAGDLTIYGKRDNVKVIREENGERSVAVVDLRSGDILESPYYFLQQNDVVYVEPNRARAGQSDINTNRSIGTYASILSVLLSLAALLL